MRHDRPGDLTAQARLARHGLLIQQHGHRLAQHLLNAVGSGQVKDGQLRAGGCIGKNKRQSAERQTRTLHASIQRGERVFFLFAGDATLDHQNFGARKRRKSLNLLRISGGRCRVRTCDPCRVKAVLYR